MRIEMNSRGNGACPLCAACGNCQVQDTLTEAMEVFSNEDDPMELVIYSCPHFVEKT
jgi:hypothetical protein